MGELVPGARVEREIGGAEVHVYRLALAAGQYVRVGVEQRGIDVVVRLFGPDGRQIVEVNSPTGTQGTEVVSHVADVEGSYRLEVQPLEKDAPKGRYEIRIEELRQASAQDQTRIAAERAFAEAELLTAQGTAESLRRAIAKYEEAARLFHALGDRQQAARCFLTVGVIFIRLSEYRNALEYLSQALSIFRAIGNRAEEARTLYTIGLVYAALGEKQKTLEYLTQALPIFRAVGDREGEAATLTSIGLVYDNLGERQKALEYYTQALPILRAVGNRAWEAITLAGIGRVYDDLGEMQKALEYYSQALSLHRAVGNRASEATTLSDIGSVYAALGERQKALEYYTQALPILRAVGNREGEAATLYNIGLVYDNLGEKQKALEYYIQALSLHRAVGNRAEEARTLYNIGLVYAALGERQKALEYYTQALSLHRAVGNRAEEARTLYNIGLVYAALGEGQKALEYYSQALSLHRAVGNRAEEAVTLSNIGRVYDALGEKQKALEYYIQALSLHRAVGNWVEEVATLTAIGRVYDALGEKQKTLEYLTQALSIFRAVGGREGEAAMLTSIGLVYDNLGERQKALEYYTQALSLHRAVGDRTGEATTLNNIGRVYAALGERQKALEYYTQALSLHRAVGNREGEATTLNNIGAVYDALGERQKALEYLIQALPIFRAVGDRAREATTLNNIGGVYAALGERQKALEYYSQALPILRAVGDRAGEATTLNNIGLVYAVLGERQKALEYYTQALSLHRAVGNRAMEATTLNNIGWVYADLGERQKALEYLIQALPIFRAVGDREGEATLLGSLAFIKRELGDLAEARVHLEDALRLIESLRAAAPGPEFRASFFASKRDAYEFYIDLLMELHEREPGKGHDLGAFEASERARARSLLELLTEARIDVTAGIAPELKERERAVHARIAGIQSQLLRAYSQAKPNSAEIAALEEALKRADEERVQIELEIRRKHPRYAALQYPAPIGVREIQGRLDEQTALLEYVLGPENAFLFVVTREGFQAIRLGATAEIRERVEKLRAAIAQGPLRTAYGNYVVNARRLYQQLVQPAEKWLAGKRSLIIVPDGSLYYLPFEVLLTTGELMPEDPRRLPYLVRTYAVSYVPSASVWAGLSRPELRRPEKTLLAYADAVYGEAGPESAVGRAFSSAFGELKKLPPLPFSRREVQGIAALYSREEVTLHLGAEAREENVKGESLDRYRFVHFAAHGLLNENAPQYSGLVLTLPSALRDAREDGVLQVYEVFNLKLNAELVVLSACETGLGKQLRGEGLIGLTRAFFYAGAEAVLVSLWKVADVSTAELMVRFYRHLKAGRGKAEALRQARLELLEQGRFVHPFYWAPFVLVGKS